MNIKIVFENSDYLVISKPNGIAAHPGADRTSYTVCEWLCEKYPSIKKLNWQSRDRIGIIHRLDKDTSGLMILAKNPKTLNYFQNQFKRRKVDKYYLALVYGQPKSKQKTIYGYISANPKNRKSQKVEVIDFGLDWRERKTTGTEYQVKKNLLFDKQNLTLLEVKILTGRKHQIRAHLKYEGLPIIGDQIYYNKPSKRLSKKLGLERQFLHAYKIFVTDPSGKKAMFTDSLPDDLQAVLNKIENVV